MDWIKLIVTAVLFTIVLSFFILNTMGIIFIIGTTFIAGLLWSYLNKLSVSRGLKEGFLLGVVIALMYEGFIIFLSGFADFMGLIQIILILGIPSAAAGGLYGLIKS